MKIFKNIKNSFYNPSFYKDKKEESGKSAMSYFLKLTLIQSIILTAIFAIVIIPLVLFVTSKESIAKIVNFIPEELTLTIKKGQLSTNVTEPYAVKSEIKNSTHKNLYVIDTKSPFSLDLLKSSDTYLLMTKDFLITEDSSGKMTVEKVSKLPDLELNRTKVNGWVYAVIPYLKFVIPLMLVIYFFVVLVANIVGSFVLILVSSCIIWCVMKILRTNFISFKQINKLGLYCITPLVVLDLLLNLFNLNIPWYASLVVFLLVFFVNVKEEREIVVSNSSNSSSYTDSSNPRT